MGNEIFYPNSIKCWMDNQDAISPIFKFFITIREVIYTTNAIESLNPSTGSSTIREACFQAIQPY